MILEKHGTPDILKEIINENITTFKDIISNNNNFNLNLNINKSNTLENGKILYLKCDLDINFHFDKKYNYTGDINYLSIINSNFKNCIINIFLPFDSEINKSLSALAHELLHLYELYQVKKIIKKTSWQNITNLINIEKLDLFKFSSINHFKNMFYLSLPHEVNARVTSIHFYLLGFETNDKEFLLKKLKETIEWRYFLMLKNFNIDEYIKILYKELDTDAIINIFNFLNFNLKINFKLKNKNDIEKYLNKIKKYFEDVSITYNKKIMKIIFDISNSIIKEKIHEDKYILSLEEIIEQKNSYRETKINYIDYF